MTTWSRDLLFQLLRHYKVPYVFGNPGTSELPFIDGVEKHEGFEYITALHEANAVGMAMGYARQSGKPAVVILHVAPGLANGMGNLYNAYRAGIPLVVIAGQHHTKLLLEEPILAGDHVGQVKSMTKWAHEVRHPEEMPLALVRAFKVAMTPPHGPVFLSVPYDISMAESPVEQLPAPLEIASAFTAEPSVLQLIAKKLLEADCPLIVAGDGVGDAHAHVELQQLAEQSGIGVLAEAMPTRQSIDNHHSHFLGTLPMNAAAIRRAFSEHDVVFYVGVNAQAPLALYDNGGSLVPEGTEVLYLHDDPWEIGKNIVGGIGAWGEIKASLQALNEELAKQVRQTPAVKETIAERAAGIVARAQARRDELAAAWQQERNLGKLTPKAVAGQLNESLPQDGRFVIVNEAVSNALPFADHIHMWEPNHYTAGKGGGLGHGASQAVGAAIAEPDRVVVGVIGDGTFLYYPQILYSAVQTKAKVLFLIVNNRSYHILKTGLKAMGAPLGGPRIPSLDLDGPADLVKMSESFGVPAERVETLDELAAALQRGLDAQGPYLVDVHVTN